MELKSNINIVSKYNVPKILRIERNRLFLYKYFRNIDNSSFYFFYQRGGQSLNGLNKDIINYTMKNKLLKLLYNNDIFCYKSFSINTISIIFVNNKVKNPELFFLTFNKFIKNHIILYLGGVFNLDKKKIFLDYPRFLMFLSIFKNFNEDFSIHSYIQYNLLKSIYQKVMMNKALFIKLCKQNIISVH